MTSTLFDKYGGFITFSQLAASFYHKILSNQILSPYFTGINIEKLVLHLSTFLAEALGGPNNYQGKDLKSAHARLHIPEAHFHEMVNVFEQVLSEANFEKQDIESILSLINKLMDQVIDINNGP